MAQKAQQKEKRLAGKNESRHIQNEKLHTNKDCAEILSGE